MVEQTKGRPKKVPADILDVIAEKVDAVSPGRFVMFEKFNAEEVRSIRRHFDNLGYETAVVRKTTLLIRRKP